jgi:hypothetical protein
LHPLPDALAESDVVELADSEAERDAEGLSDAAAVVDGVALSRTPSWWSRASSSQRLS